MHHVCQFNFVVPARAEACRCPFADAVHCQNGSLIKWTGEKGACGVGFVVFGENIAALVLVVQSPVYFPGQMQLQPQPQWHTHKELLKTSGGITDVGFEQPFEFQKRLLIENYIIELFGSEPPGLESILDRICRELAVMLLSCKSLLLGGGDNFAIAHKRCSTVMVEGRYSQNIHTVISIKITPGKLLLERTYEPGGNYKLYRPKRKTD